MSGSQPHAQHWPEEGVWARKLRRFRGRLSDDPAISHLLATIYTEARTNASGVVRADIMLAVDGKPSAPPNLDDTGPAVPSPERGRALGADLTVGANTDWDEKKFLSKVQDIVDEFIEFAQQTPQPTWYVLDTTARDDLDADWCLVYARDGTHAVRKPPLPDGAPWGDRPGVDVVGTWEEFVTAVWNGRRWDRESSTVYLDADRPDAVSAPAFASEVVAHATE